MRNFILDTNILMAYLKTETKLFNKVSEDNNLNDEDAFIMISSITKGEMLSLALQNNWGERKVSVLTKLLNEFVIIDVGGSNDLCIRLSKYIFYNFWKLLGSNSEILLIG